MASDGERSVELPGDESSVDLPSSSSSVELPVEAESVTQSRDECCRNGCVQALLECPAGKLRVADLHSVLDGATKEDANKIRFDCLRHWLSPDAASKGTSSTSNQGWRKYSFCGIPLCREALCYVLAMSRTLFQKLKDHAALGHCDPPADMRSSAFQVARNKDSETSADSLLSWIHAHLAEPFVEAGDLYVTAKRRLGDFSRSGQFFQLTPTSRDDVRYLAPNTTLKEIRETASWPVLLHHFHHWGCSLGPY